MQKNDENVEVVEDAAALGREVPLEGEEEAMASAYSTESFVYLDDAGNPLPPEEETSRLMAAGLRGHPNHQHHNIHQSHPPTNNDDGNHSGTVGRATSDVVMNAGAASASSATTGQQQQQYNEDPDVFERERLLAIKRLEEALLDDNDEDEGSEENVEAAAVARTAQPSSSGVAPTTTTKNAENDGDDDDGDEEEEVYFSREATPGEDEWILERILDRRAIKTNTAKGTSSDYKVFYDDFGEKKAGMMAAGRVEYLCKWRWYEEPTWESRELLEDENYFKEIKSFEETSAKNNKKGTSAVVKIAQKWTDIRPEDAVDMVVSNNKKKKTYETVMRGLEDGLEYGNTKAIAQLVDFNIVDQIGRVCQDGLYIYGYGTCTTNEKIGSFLKLYQKMQSTHRPIILYHGSQLSNLSSICRNGLRVPSGKSEVSNGSVHGVGVYAAFRPGDAACFSNADEYGCLRILCCVALVSPTDPDINMVYCVVFQQPKMILPVWALDLSDCSHLSGIDHRCFTYETIGKRLGRPAGFELRHYINVTPAPTVKLDSGKSKTLTKVRNKNILQINKLAETEACWK